jgi:hypothetical protein
LANEEAGCKDGEKVVVDVYTALIGLASICFLVGTAAKMLQRQPKVWDEEDWTFEETEEIGDDREIREKNPHIWMD